MSTGGDASVLGAPPVSVANNVLIHSNLTRVFLESRLRLSAPLLVDSTSSGRFLPNDAIPGGVAIAGGTEIESYFLHFDTDDIGEKSSVGSVTFDTDILGLPSRKRG